MKPLRSRPAKGVRRAGQGMGRRLLHGLRVHGFFADRIRVVGAWGVEAKGDRLARAARQGRLALPCEGSHVR